MKIKKPKFWYDKNLISYFFFPFSLITNLINFFKKYSKVNYFSIKTICIGNINIGGTGKTSLAIEINNIIKKKNKTVFIKKNYKDQKDEIKLLKKNGNTVIASDRINALEKAQKKFKVAILDDGLQQKNIYYNLKIVCFNSDEGFGNELLLPAGPLRENVYELKKYDIAFLNGEKKNKSLYNKIKSINKKIKIFSGKYEPQNLRKLNKNKKYFMFCGIGNPQEFENTLEKYKFNIVKKKIFPDHYEIPDSQIKKMREYSKKNDLELITTEKDFLRLNKNYKKNINFLKVNLKISDLKNFKKILLSKI